MCDRVAMVCPSAILRCVSKQQTDFFSLATSLCLVHVPSKFTCVADCFVKAAASPSFFLLWCPAAASPIETTHRIISTILILSL